MTIWDLMGYWESLTDDENKKEVKIKTDKEMYKENLTNLILKKINIKKK